jgi:amino acid transporter
MVVASVAMTVLNYRGLDIVGQSSKLIVVLILLPFVALVILGGPQVETSNWFQRAPISEVNWSNFLNVMFWNLNYWDSVSTLAGEVRRYAKV